VWLATDCDREGQLIGQEILEHYDYRGVVMRVMFTAQDPQTIRDAFARARPNAEYARLYAAAVARRQADQIYNLSLTRTATVTLARGTRTVIGVGRAKTPTLAIVCRRELEIRSFVPQAYFEVVAMAQVDGGRFRRVCCKVFPTGLVAQCSVPRPRFRIALLRSRRPSLCRYSRPPGRQRTLQQIHPEGPSNGRGHPVSGDQLLAGCHPCGAPLGTGKLLRLRIVGERGRPIDALILRIFVTPSHTSGIVLVALLATAGQPS
jgi:hypothetical protein